MKYTIALVLAVVLSGCGDDTPPTVTVVKGQPNPSYTVSPKKKDKNLGPDREGFQLVPNVGILVAQFEEVRTRRLAAAIAVLAREGALMGDDICPPREIPTVGSRVVRMQSPITPFLQGSGTRYFHASVDDVTHHYPLPLVVKVSNTMEAITGMVREAAFEFITRASGGYVAPEVFDIVPSADHRISELCRLRTLITEYRRSRMFVDPSRVREGWTLSSLAASRLPRAIARIRAVHALGFVHGDIQASKFERPIDGYDGVEVIGFEMAEPYVDASGNHVRNIRGVTQDLPLAAELLSPWDLEGSRISRRDDIFRLAEMALQLAGLDEPYAASLTAMHTRFNTEYAGRQVDSIPEYRDAVKELKRNRPSLANPAVPAAFREFYLYALAMEFDAVPDYDRWIHAFWEYESTTIPDIYTT